jgi:Ribbon-helix-helix protein, copG family
MSYQEPNTEIRMQRITITIEDDLLAEIDAAAEARGYQNRSEIIRDLARAGLRTPPHQANASPRWSMSTITPPATCRSGWCRISTATTICRWRRCTSISTMTLAWK